MYCIIHTWPNDLGVTMMPCFYKSKTECQEAAYDFMGGQKAPGHSYVVAVISVHTPGYETILEEFAE